jgi:hypothetical protein
MLTASINPVAAVSTSSSAGSGPWEDPWTSPARDEVRVGDCVVGVLGDVDGVEAISRPSRIHRCDTAIISNWTFSF